MQGVGFIPGYKRSFQLTVDEVEEEKRASERGLYGRFKKLPAPELKDVLYSLIIDSNVLDYDSFESWASDFGYDTDSRKAEAIYKEALRQSLQFKQLLDPKKLDELKELFQDY